MKPCIIITEMNRLGALCFASAVLMVTAKGYDTSPPEEKELINQLIKVANDQFTGYRHLDYTETLENTKVQYFF